jgi:hypothetical protein
LYTAFLKKTRISLIIPTPFIPQAFHYRGFDSRKRKSFTLIIANFQATARVK